MALALHTHKMELANTGSEQQSINMLSLNFGVSSSTLGQLVQGGTPLSVFNARKCLLSTAEEEKLVEYVINSADHGFLLTHKNI